MVLDLSLHLSWGGPKDAHTAAASAVAYLQNQEHGRCGCWQCWQLCYWQQLCLVVVHKCLGKGWPSWLQSLLVKKSTCEQFRLAFSKGLRSKMSPKLQDHPSVLYTFIIQTKEVWQRVKQLRVSEGLTHYYGCSSQYCCWSFQSECQRFGWRSW